MKSLALSLLVTLSSSFAYADYFYCEIRSGFLNQRQEAEYRTYSAQAVLRAFSCLGQMVSMDGDMKVVTTLISNITPEEYVTVVGTGSATTQLTALDIHGDGQDTATCTCGLN